VNIQKVVGFSLIAIGVVGGLLSNLAYGLFIVFVGLLFVSPKLVEKLTGKKQSPKTSTDSTPNVEETELHLAAC
jgi:uncharacterized membrane protein YbaN (DUF454 family)